MGNRTRAGRSVRAVAGGAARAWRGALSAFLGTGRLTRRVTHAQGAGRSGLGSLIEASAFNSAGDALLTVALAGTLFFGLDVNQARGQVALYLVVTMAPFALVAPLIGPALDRARHVRRYAIASTFVMRALLCWAMASALPHGDQVTFLPAAFGVLVLSKAFGVLRAAVTPRVLPDEITLVTANARCSFAGLIAASITAPIGAGLAVLIGPGWVLRIGTAVFLLGVVFTMRLPQHVDVPEVEPAEQNGDGPRRRFLALPRVGPVVAEAMEANAVLRAFSGFLIIYLAFLLRQERFDPVSHHVALGLLAACAGAGGLIGTSLGAWMKARAPRFIVSATLASVTAVTAARRRVLRAVGGARGGDGGRSRPGARQAVHGRGGAARDRRGDALVHLRGLRDAAPAQLGARRAARPRHVDRRGRPGRARDRRGGAGGRVRAAGVPAGRHAPAGAAAARPQDHDQGRASGDAHLIMVTARPRSGPGPRSARAQGARSSATARSTVAIFFASAGAGCLPRR
ncbi:hypothetical protein LUX57_36410 [Actinomadura madurae]|uniref:MFS transporter n=1 Tax=Actinomadura madurae TaxID=1993 RepID=UPI0020D228C0|nr:MFS transporter [Actinomadura madurae]MCP9969995.1 hypothetical protein [Actinomadura madurae]